MKLNDVVSFQNKMETAKRKVVGETDKKVERRGDKERDVVDKKREGERERERERQTDRERERTGDREENKKKQKRATEIEIKK